MASSIQDMAQHLLSDNPYFAAGFGLFGLGAATALLRRASVVGALLFRRNCTMTLEVPSHDKSYRWLLQWITRYGNRSAQHMSVETRFEQNEAGRVRASYDFIPSTGIHYFRYGSYWIRVERTREKQMLGVASAGGAPFESVTLTTVGRERRLFMRILDEARSMALLQEEGWTIIFKSYGSEWRPFGYPRKRRPVESVVLDQGLAEKLIGDVRDFIDNQQWYTTRGIPYRRGYLLYGPPGCGKSSFITALAGALEYNICVLSLAEMGMTGDRLDHLLTHAPLQSIILLEDVDAATVNRQQLSKDEAVAYQGMPRLSLSGLLNAIDGVASTEGRILFMTTNYINRLDPALIRPGRVDLQVHIGLCSLQQLQRMFQRFYPEADELQGREFAEKIGGGLLSPAEVQGFFLMNKDNPTRALKDCALLRQTKSQTQ